MFSRTPLSELPKEIKSACPPQPGAKAGVPVLRTLKRKEKTFRREMLFSVDRPGLIGVTLVNANCVAVRIGNHGHIGDDIAAKCHFDDFQHDDGCLGLNAPRFGFPAAKPGTRFKSFAADRCRRCRKPRRTGRQSATSRTICSRRASRRRFDCSCCWASSIICFCNSTNRR